MRCARACAQLKLQGIVEESSRVENSNIPVSLNTSMGLSSTTTALAVKSAVESATGIIKLHIVFA